MANSNRNGETDRPLLRLKRREAFFNTPTTKDCAGVACNVDQDSEYANYKDEAGCFHHRMDVTASRHFSLKPVIIPSGPYAGMKAMVMVPSTHFPLHKLPPELRALIYEYALCSNGTVHVHTEYRGGHDRLTSSFNSKSPTQVRPQILSLLLVDRATHKEAREFLYKNQHFVFSTMTNLNIFLEGIGDAKRFLTRITVDRSGTAIARKCYTHLAKAVRLRMFSVCLAPNFKGTLQEHISKHWESLSIFLLADGSTENESLRRLQMISFTVGSDQRGVMDSTGKAIRRITPEMNEECRVQVKAYLRIHFAKGAGQTTG